MLFSCQVPRVYSASCGLCSEARARWRPSDVDVLTHLQSWYKDADEERVLRDVLRGLTTAALRRRSDADKFSQEWDITSSWKPQTLEEESLLAFRR